MTYYEVIAGSRSYALEIASSDIDLCRVSDAWNMGAKEGDYNLLQIPAEEFAERIVGDRNSPYYLQWLFPYEVRSSNGLTAWLQENRELIISSQLRRVHQMLYRTACGLKMHSDWMYDLFPKRMAYSTHFFSVIANYAEGMPFAEAHVASGDLRDKLLAMRQKALPLAEAMAICDQQQARAEAAAAFYETETEHSVLDEVRKRIFAAVSEV